MRGGSSTWWEWGRHTGSGSGMTDHQGWNHGGSEQSWDDWDWEPGGGAPDHSGDQWQQHTWAAQEQPTDPWYGGGADSEWQVPTEAPSKSTALPIALGVTVAVLGVAVIGAGAWLVLGRETGSPEPIVEAGTTGSQSAWTTTSASPTSSASAAGASTECSADEIKADTAVISPVVTHCRDGWAVVSDGPGVPTVVRNVGGQWEITGSTANGCPGADLVAAMPASLVREAFGEPCLNFNLPGRTVSAPPVQARSARTTSPTTRVSTTATRRTSTPRQASVTRNPVPPPAPAPAPPPVPAVEPPPPAPEPPSRDTLNDLRELGNAANDLLDALDGVRGAGADGAAGGGTAGDGTAGDGN